MHVASCRPQQMVRMTMMMMAAVAQEVAVALHEVHAMRWASTWAAAPVVAVPAAQLASCLAAV